MKRLFTCLFAIAVCAGGACAAETPDAGKVGELHRLIPDPSAAVRDAGHDAHARLTVWYPASADAVERPVAIGPPGKPLFEGGEAAPDASWRDAGARYPLILISHGFGGSDRQTAWLGTALARRGFVVAGVDHPGNNGVDPMTLAGAVLWWLRAADLRAALAYVTSDPMIGPHVDASRLGVAGFSIGGFTALDFAGARPDPRRYRRHCAAHPDDGVCLPQKELPELDPRKRPQAAIDLWRANPPIAVPAPPIRALFLMAPAVISAFEPASLRNIRAPTTIILGDADQVATPRFNGRALARLLPHAMLVVIPPANHYDFLDACTAAGQAEVKVYCRPPGDDTQALAHDVATRRAISLFEATLK